MVYLRRPLLPRSQQVRPRRRAECAVFGAPRPWRRGWMQEEEDTDFYTPIVIDDGTGTRAPEDGVDV